MASGWSNEEIESDLKKLLKIGVLTEELISKSCEKSQDKNFTGRPSYPQVKVRKSVKNSVRDDIKPQCVKHNAPVFPCGTRNKPSNFHGEVILDTDTGLTNEKEIVNDSKYRATEKLTLEESTEGITDPLKMKISKRRQKRKEMRKSDKTKQKLKDCVPTVPNTKEQLGVSLSSSMINDKVKDTSNELKLNAIRNGLLNSDAAVKEILTHNLLMIDAHPEIPVPVDVLAILEAHHIFPLTKKTSRHLNARYVCRLCIYHCDNVTVCTKHLKSDKHLALKKEMDDDVLLQHIPVCSDAQAKALEALLVSTVSNVGLRNVDIKNRKAILAELKDLLNHVLIDGCELIMFGSSESSLGCKESNLNISLDIRPESNLNPAAILHSFLQILSSKNTYVNVEMNLEGKIPSILFLHKKTSIKCVIGLGNAISVKTTYLLQSYAAFDERARVLCITFRHWAKICNLNVQENGTMPPHTFDLMVIFFLQNCKPPILPVFHEVSVKDGETLNPKNIKTTWKTENQCGVGHLWVEMLRFYALVFPKSDLVVCIRQSGPMIKSKKQWRAWKFAVEDPYHPRRNLTRCVRSSKVYDFIMASLKLSFKYFGIPQLNNGPLFESNTLLASSVTGMQNDLRKRGTNHDSRTTSTTSTNDNEDSLSAESNDGSESDDDNDDIKADNVNLKTNAVTKMDSKANSKVNEKVLQEKNIEENSSKSSRRIECDSHRLPITSDLLQKFYAVKIHTMQYNFIWKKLTGGKFPVLECNICKREGHLDDNCPDQRLPPLFPLPQMHPAFMDIICTACNFITNNAPGKRERDDRMAILSDLQSFIRQIYPDALLRMFGSSCNGFGFKGSDLDICLTFENNTTGENIQHADIINVLAIKLKKHKMLYPVIAIPTAKVPIVKFIHRQHNLECDLSLYNNLAQYNTSLLCLYSEIDHRVKVLGYTMKYFAKVCEIGDASRGSLSSYAYVLMVLYFLQQRKPPVIPVLQQLYDKNQSPPEEMVDRWNAWFFKDIKNIHKVWPFLGVNKESVGELWLGLLRFYTEEFNFKQHVVCIRRLEPLTIFEKLWNSKSIAIEDPFILSHNLGSGVSRKMNTYILKTFIKGRWIFGTPLLVPPMRYRYIQEYLFDPKQLTNGPPPNDRCCHVCGRIGHQARDCPRKTTAKEKREKRAPKKTNTVNHDQAIQDIKNKEVITEEVHNKPTSENQESQVNTLDVTQRQLDGENKQQSRPTSKKFEAKQGAEELFNYYRKVPPDEKKMSGPCMTAQAQREYWQELRMFHHQQKNIQPPPGFARVPQVAVKHHSFQGLPNSVSASYNYIGPSNVAPKMWSPGQSQQRFIDHTAFVNTLPEHSFRFCSPFPFPVGGNNKEQSRPVQMNMSAGGKTSNTSNCHVMPFMHSSGIPFMAANHPALHASTEFSDGSGQNFNRPSMSPNFDHGIFKSQSSDARPMKIGFNQSELPFASFTGRRANQVEEI